MAIIHRRNEMPGRALSPTPLRREFDRLQREMNQLMTGFGPEEAEGEAWSPDVDVYEDEKGLRFKADVPGIDRKDIDIKVDGNVLTLTGKREQSKEEKRENYQRVERFYGEFARSFTLPEYADSEKVEASFKNGVLEIWVPALPEAKRQTKRIEIKAS